MKLITLIENDLGSNPNLICEFGFSVFIQDEDISLIFDIGQIGTDFSQDYLKKKRVTLNFINDHIHIISKNITAFTNFENLNNFELINKLHYRRKNGTFTLDNMSDEIVLGLDTHSGFFLLCGCSHIGIVNIIENVKKWTGKKITGIIGGLHLNKSNHNRIYKTAEYLKKENIQYLVLSHCTGKNTIKLFKTFGLNTISNNTGNIFIL